MGLRIFLGNPSTAGGPGTSVAAPRLDHSYMGRVPQVRAQVCPVQVTHSYTGRVPVMRVGPRVSVVLVTHTYTSGALGFKTSIPAPRVTHTYTGRVPAVAIAVPPVYGFGARARIGGTPARDPWKSIGGTPAKAKKGQIGDERE